MIVLWRITEHCNLSCGFCAYDRRVRRTRRETQAESVLRLAPILRDYQQHTGDAVLLSWIGGEPLLWQPWFELSCLLREQSGIAISTTTNGSTLQQPAVRAQVLRCLSELTISVDGLGPFHDAVRGWPGGWQRLARSIMALHQERHRLPQQQHAPLKLRANVVLMHDNLAEFPALCAALADWGLDEITFNPLGGRDRPEFFPAQQLTPDDVERLLAMLPGLQNDLAARGVRLCASDDYLQRIAASANQRAIPVADCGPGQHFLFIDEQDRVAPCHFTTAEWGIPLADIHGVQDLLDVPQRFVRARQAVQPQVCQDCPSTQVFAKFAS